MQLCNNLNQNEYKIIIILIKSIFFHQRIHHEHLLLHNKLLAYFLATYKSMLVEVIPKQDVNV